VRGLSKEKLRFLKRVGKDTEIFGLSETHASPEKKIQLLDKFFGSWTLINSFKSSKSAGVTLAISPKLQPSSTGSTDDGRLAWAIIDDVLVACVYLPNNVNARVKLINETLAPLISNKSVIIMGDFNITDSKSRRDNLALQTLLHNNDLVDVAEFTRKERHTYVSPSHGTRTRIDYIFMSEELVCDEIDFQTVALPNPPFDHAALRLDWKKKKSSGSNRWIMNDKWLELIGPTIMKKFDELSCDSQNWDYFKLFVKTCIQTVSANSTRNSDRETDELRSLLEELWDEDPEGKYKAASDQIFQRELEKEEGASLRARASFDKNVDTPTGTFTRLLERRNKENKITLINQESLTDDAEIVSRILTQHMNEVHQQKNCVPDKRFVDEIPISPQRLDGEISAEEVEEAISKLRNNSSPGLDGFVPGFYKRFKDHLAPYLAKLYNKILAGQPEPADFKTAIIRFIAKKDSDLKTPKGWRPISLLNCDFKILTQVLAARLQKVLHLLTKNIAYIPGRFIIENILTVEAIFRNDERMLLLLTDFVAAFDSLSHDWIRLVVKNAQLGAFFENAIDFLLKDMIAHPIVGSTPMKDIIYLKAGVRQGDPLSGLLFVLCIEPLLRAAAPLVNQTLAYADDLSFVVSNSQNASNLIKLIKSFECVSGLKLSTSKTKIIDTKDPSAALGRNIEGINFVSSFTYLGYSFDHNGIEQKLVVDKLDEVIDKLNYLKRLNLCTSQKIVVLNTYAFSALYYYLWASSPSKPFFKLCEKVQRWFLGCRKDKFHHSNTYSLPTALAVYRRPKSHGGFGLANVKAKSAAMKWRLFERYRNVDSPFRNLLYSLLCLAQPKKCANVLHGIKRIPTLATGYARELIYASQRLTPTFSAKDSN
jgi:exonuclease III